ncbi:hypothetical protein [Robertkochia sediminum]|uniref:hypothetical protein n=1 Tax=Robertkochia sediminum TaxID=2785326 RepID=UPI001933ED85|nr:hypothetical protein [Robertkochia sediminum]MBL7471392.1 hypothetical protein [Robertkochia sediminum]
MMCKVDHLGVKGSSRTRLFLSLLLGLLANTFALSQERELLSIFRVDYSELRGEDISPFAKDCNMAIIFHRRNGQLRISRTCLNGESEIDGYVEHLGTMTLMESEADEKWMLSFQFIWQMQIDEYGGEKFSGADIPAKALIALLQRKDRPLFLHFKLFSEGEWYPDIAMEAELVQGSEAWDNMIFNWQQHAERRDPPQ